MNRIVETFSPMTTTGKSDVFEAVAQVVVLKILYERGIDRGDSLVKELRRRPRGLEPFQEASGYLAISKLESSGWIQRSMQIDPRSCSYQLSKTASRFLARELNDWRAFVEQWPRIQSVLKAIVAT